MKESENLKVKFLFCLFFSKNVEHHIHNQLSHLEKCNILCSQQCGFTTNIAIANLLKQILDGLDERNYGIDVFLDLQKPFDMVYQ